MKKFLIMRVCKNDHHILASFDDKETALKEGQKIYDSIPEKCTVTCIQAEVDQLGNILGNRVLFYKAWF